MIAAADIVAALAHYYEGRSGVVVTELTAEAPDYARWRETPGKRDWRSRPAANPRRIDVLAAQGGRLSAVEVKVSRADFLRETDSKREPWLAYAHKFMYAAPAGLIRPDEVPARCGLFEYREGGIFAPGGGGHIVLVKRPRVSKTVERLPFEVVQRLMYKAKKVGGM